MKLAVYALTDARRLPAGTGVSGERLRLYREGSVAAVAGEVRRPPASSPGNVRRYDGTMRRLAASTSALLPARFGTCVDDAEELRFIIRSRQPALRRALARVRNRVQMTVRVLTVPSRGGADRKSLEGSDGPPHGGASRNREAASRSREPGGAAFTPLHRPRGSGTEYLHGRAEAVARERKIPGFEPVRASVERWIRDERVEARAGMVSVYHLIPRAAADGYQRTLARAAAVAGVRVLVSGPWPPYAFADI